MSFWFVLLFYICLNASANAFGLGVSHLEFVIFYWLFCLFLSTHSISQQTNESVLKEDHILLLIHRLISLWRKAFDFNGFCNYIFLDVLIHGFASCFSDAQHLNFWETNSNPHLTYSWIDQCPLIHSDKRSMLLSKSLNCSSFVQPSKRNTFCLPWNHFHWFTKYNKYSLESTRVEEEAHLFATKATPLENTWKMKKAKLAQ